MNTKFIIYTDLDGTLLNHDSYSWEAASTALELTKNMGYPIIFNSSKTFAELIPLAREMRLEHPMIAENGSVIAIPHDYFYPSTPAVPDSGYNLTTFGEPYSELVDELDQIRDQYHFKFTGFHDMNTSDVIALTGLDQESAQLAMQRQTTEPFIWQDTDDNFTRFKALLNNSNKKITRGGRFSHVLPSFNKGDAIDFLNNHFRNTFCDVNWLTIGLGDSENDLEMLANVDYPVLVSNRAKEPLNTDTIENINITVQDGPAGWNSAVIALINQYGKGAEYV